MFPKSEFSILCWVQPQTSGRGELRGVFRVFFILLLLFFLNQGESANAALLSPPPLGPVVRGSGCQRGARIQNPVVFLLFMAESPPHPHPTPLSCVWPPGRWLLRSPGVDEWGVPGSHVRSAPFGHSEPGSRSGRTPPCLHIYPQTVKQRPRQANHLIPHFTAT